MTVTTAEGARVTLPRWFVVMLFGALTAAGGAFLRLDTRLSSMEVRLAVIETRTGFYAPPQDARQLGQSATPPAPARP